MKTIGTILVVLLAIVGMTAPVLGHIGLTSEAGASASVEDGIATVAAGAGTSLHDIASVNSFSFGVADGTIGASAATGTNLNFGEEGISAAMWSQADVGTPEDPSFVYVESNSNANVDELANVETSVNGLAIGDANAGANTGAVISTDLETVDLESAGHVDVQGDIAGTGKNSATAEGIGPVDASAYGHVYGLGEIVVHSSATPGEDWNTAEAYGYTEGISDFDVLAHASFPFPPD